MIQSILFFTLGFLTAGFLALLIAPAIWRRAVALTRRRIEASVPLSLSDIQADKDRMRAEFAMSTRRLEMSVKSAKEKAAAQVVEINRNREELKRLAAECDERDRSISELEARAGELRAELAGREERLRQLGERLGEADRTLEERALEIKKLGRAFDEASFAASNRQIELVARESEVDKLAGDVRGLRGQHKEAEQRMRDANADAKAARDALKAEHRKATDLEKKVERMAAALADRDEKLDRRERELARLRQQVKGGDADEGELAARLEEAQEEKAGLEARLAELTAQMTTLLSGAKGGDVEKAAATLAQDCGRLESRLTALTRENRRLKAELGAHERAGAEDRDDERRASALLRDEISDLAAEVVALTARLEGPDSPIDKALGAETVAEQPAGPQEKTVSLADRVRALRKAAPAS